MPRIIPVAMVSLLALVCACGSSRNAATEPLDLVIEEAGEAEIVAVRVPSGKYAAAFDAARHELRDAGFMLERVDAYSGVITTQPSTSAGFATPWSQDQSSVEQELGDFFQRHARTVRITFSPADEVEAGPVDAVSGRDMRAVSGELVMRTQVVVERAYRPGWKINNNSIRHSTYFSDPDLAARGMEPVYSVARSEDRLLARRIAERIAGARTPVVAATPAP